LKIKKMGVKGVGNSKFLCFTSARVKYSTEKNGNLIIYLKFVTFNVSWSDTCSLIQKENRKFLAKVVHEMRSA